MTAARRPRVAALLVGSTSGTSANVESAAQNSSRVFGSARTWRCRLPVDPTRAAHLLLDLLRRAPAAPRGRRLAGTDGEILQGREIDDAVEHERARGRGFGVGVADGRDVPADRGTARLVRRDAIHEDGRTARRRPESSQTKADDRLPLI